MQLVRRSRDHAVGTQECFLVCIWRRHTPAAEVLHIGGVLAELSRQHVGGVHLMQVIEESATLPDSESRTALSELLRDAAGSVAFSSVVHEGGGFRPSLIRSVVTGLLLLHKPVFPHLVFSGTAPALERHAAALGLSTSDTMIRNVASAVSELRAAIMES